VRKSGRKEKEREREFVVGWKVKVERFTMLLLLDDTKKWS
jgi:hypothetical protein